MDGGPRDYLHDPLTARTTDPLTFERMVDPVMCSDGRTYCRWSALRAIESGVSMPGTSARRPFVILCDNFDVRGDLFQAYGEEAEAEWKRRRREYLEQVGAEQAKPVD
jgi:hypothetical protein